MKALIYTGVEQLSYQDSPMPKPGDGEVLVRITASGICGSDMHAFLGHDERRPAPLILGHEAAGYVVENGTDTRRVAINPLVNCGTCRDCQAGKENLCAKRQIISMMPREGAFAEYVAIPERNLVTVPDGVPLEHAALTEPQAVSWHGVRLGQKILDTPLGGLKSVVIGGGAIGVGAALALKAFGADDITLLEPNETRRTALQAIGGFKVADPEDATACDAATADFVIDGVGFEATRAKACSLVRQGGVIAHIGLGDNAGGLDVRRMTLQEITFIGCYTYTMQDFRDTAAAIFEGRLGTLDWIEQRALSDGQSAFDDIRAGRTAAPKIILIPAHEE